MTVRRAFLVCLLAACHANPDTTGDAAAEGGAGCGGGGCPLPTYHLLRQGTAVADLDGDGFDDLVLWGHAGSDAHGSDAMLFIQWGPSLDMASSTRVPLAFPAAPAETGGAPGVWTEPVAVAASFDATGSASLVAWIGVDLSLPPQTTPDRYNYLERIPINRDRSTGTPTRWHHPAHAALGGYVDEGTAPFVFECTDGSGNDQILFGEKFGAFPVDGDLENAVSSQIYSLEQAPNMTTAATEQGLFLLPAGSDHSQLLFDIANVAAYTSPGDLTAVGSDLEIAFGNAEPYVASQIGNRIVRAGALDGVLASAVSVEASSDIAITTLTDASSAPSTYYFHAMVDGGITDVVAIGDATAPLIFTADGVFANVSLPGTASEGGILDGVQSTSEGYMEGETYSLLATGHFGGRGQPVQFFMLSRTSFDYDPPICFQLGSDHVSLAPQCTVDSGSGS